MQWIPWFGPKCCDATTYMAEAVNCIQNGNCFESMRPIGSALYQSIPLALGMPPEGVILINWAFILLSTFLASRALIALWPELKGQATLVPMILAAHFIWMYEDARSALSDVPSACFALIAIWLLILGIRNRKSGYFLGAGLFTGAASLMRVFYLYPGYVLMVMLGLGTAFGKDRDWKLPRQFALAFMLPVVLQYGITWSKTGAIAFSGEDANSSIASMHFRLPYWGYDTLNNPLPARGLPYVDPCPLREPAYGLIGAVHGHDYLGAFKFLMLRQYFYFASYSSRTYLMQIEDRTFSGWFLVANLFALSGMLATLFFDRRNWATLMYVLACWGMATVVVPEQRFMDAIYVLMWILGPVYWLGKRARRDAMPLDGLAAPVLAPPVPMDATDPHPRRRAKPRRPAARPSRRSRG